VSLSESLSPLQAYILPPQFRNVFERSRVINLSAGASALNIIIKRPTRAITMEAYGAQDEYDAPQTPRCNEELSWRAAMTRLSKLSETEVRTSPRCSLFFLPQKKVP